VKPRTPKREQFLLDVFVTAIENYGYGFFVTEQYVWDVPAAQAYAVIADKQDESRRWRVDIDTMATGLRVIRTAKQITQGGETYRVNADGQRLYFGGPAREAVVAADRSNGDEGDIDVIGALAVLECALFGRVVYP